MPFDLILRGDQLPIFGEPARDSATYYLMTHNVANIWPYDDDARLKGENAALKARFPSLSEKTTGRPSNMPDALYARVMGNPSEGDRTATYYRSGAILRTGAKERT